MLDEITPVILTYNEEPNLYRTLAAVEWARDIVIVDSFSTDRTLEIAARFPKVRVFQRPFDILAQQWTFATQQTNISTDWILALDADYLLTSKVVDELRTLKPDETVAGYRAFFRYLVAGVPLRATLYPPVTVLFRRGRERYLQDGHAQRLKVNGLIANLENKIHHDDRKPLSRWLRSQDLYAQLEKEKLSQAPSSGLQLPDKIRKFPAIAPFLVFAYCYIGKGNFLDGKIGLYYSLQRLLAEALLSLRILEEKLDIEER